MHASALLSLESSGTPHGLRRWPPHLRLAAGLLTAVVVVALPTTVCWAQAACLGLLLIAGWTHGVRLGTMLGRLAPIAGLGLTVLGLMLLLGPENLQAGALGGQAFSAAPAQATRLALWALLSKTGLAVLTFTVLSGVLTPGELLVAMRRLRVPRTLRVVTYLALHWLREIAEQASALRRAAISRGQPQGYRRVRLAWYLGRALMQRCVRRADTLAFALCARGFTGELPVLDCHPTGRGAAWGFVGYCLLLGTLSALAWWV